jgi:Mn-dependent DtxR family transcriptional regulator
VGFVSIESVRPLFAGRSLRAAVADASRAGFLDASGERLALTERGRSAAAEIVRRHRLWEHYLVKEVALAPDHVHATAERLEHISAAPASGPQCDPHGRPIPDRE